MRSRIFWIVLILVVVVLTTSAVSAVIHKVTGKPSFIENALGSATSWVQSFFSRTGSGMTKFFRGPYWDKETSEEYKALKEEVAGLRAENQQLDELRAENERLLGLLGGSAQFQGHNPVHARVINRAQGPWSSVLVLDKGTSDGIAKDMAVITGDGLVGRVIEAGATWCKVLCVIDNQSAVSALVERTRDPGIVKGNLTAADADALLNMVYLPNESDLAPGDKILTSGMGGVFPKGILIGEVVAVSRMQSAQRTVTVRPAVDFSCIEEVLVLSSGVESVPVS